ncbi:hypothetical protein IWX91DRAFT_70229 [Phyllosticta citricarpa]
MSDDIYGARMGIAWGYTAGSFRRNFSASLTFGGYDLSRFNLTGAVENPINVNASSPLQLTVQEVTVWSSNYSSFGTGYGSPDLALNATVEPALPYLWLPESWCSTIAYEFNLTWDAERQLYAVPENISVESPDLRVSLKLCGNGACEPFTLPFSAYVLATDLTSNTSTNIAPSRYFAMRPSENLILGRVFFQETYLFADYDRNFFRIGKAIFDKNAEPVIIASEGRPEDPVLNTGEIVGIVISGVTVLATVGYLVLAKFRDLWPFRNRPNTPDDDVVDGKPELDGEGKPWAELSGKEQQELPSAGKPNEVADSAGEDVELEGSIPLYELPAGYGQVPEGRSKAARS